MHDLEGRRPAGAAADLGAAPPCRRIPSIPFPPLGKGEKVRGRRRPPAVSPWSGRAPPAYPRREVAGAVATGGSAPRDGLAFEGGRWGRGSAAAARARARAAT